MKNLKNGLALAVVFLLITISFGSNINASDVSKFHSKQFEDNNEYVLGQIIVGFENKKAYDNSVLFDFYKNLRVVGSDSTLNYKLVEVEPGQEKYFINEIRKNPNVEYAELNRYMYAYDLEPNDPEWEVQWGPEKINCAKGWSNNNFGSKDVVVAIVDTGIDYTHEDLKDNYISGGKNHVNPANSNDPKDDNDHGTHCAGIVAATMNNGKGISGVGQVSIMAEKVLTSYGSGTRISVSNGIRHAVDSGADIISLSLGSPSSTKVIENACNYAWDNNVLVVAAAGNDGSTVGYPAAYENVIAVGAIDSSLQRTWWSNYGSELELVAPGDDILSTVIGNDYEMFRGTSMACPHVSGVAALLKSWGINDVAEIRKKLQETAIDLGKEGRDDEYGYGLVDASIAGESPAGNEPFFVAVHKISNLDSIEPAGDPEWYYKIEVETSTNKDFQYNFNLEVTPNHVGSGFFWDTNWISESTWNPETVHLFYVSEPIVDITISLKDSDFMFDDTADISSDPERHEFKIKYNTDTHSIILDESDHFHQTDNWFIADGELDQNDGDEDDSEFWFMVANNKNKPPEITSIHVQGNKMVDEELKFLPFVYSGQEPCKYFWNFGDGYSSDQKEPSHVYKNPGSYLVTLTVIDSNNQSSNKFQKFINILGDDGPEIVSLTGDQYLKTDKIGKYYAVATDPNGLDLSYGWDTDDDGKVNFWTDLYSSGTECDFSASWNEIGLYTIKVKAKNSNGIEGDFKSLNIEIPKVKEKNHQSIKIFMNNIFDNLFVFEEILNKIFNLKIN